MFRDLPTAAIHIIQTACNNSAPSEFERLCKVVNLMIHAEATQELIKRTKYPERYREE